MIFLIFLFVVVGLPAGAQPVARFRSGTSELVLTDGLAVRTSRNGRTPIYVDEVAHGLATGSFTAPAEGDTLGLDATGEAWLWTAVTARENGYFEDPALRGGYLYASIRVDRAAILLLEASGHSMVWVNGSPRAGDVYDYGWIRQPVELKKGINHFLFAVSRGRIRARLTKPDREVALTTLDPTLPDLVQGTPDTLWAAVRLINTSTSEQNGLSLRARIEGSRTLTTGVPPIGPVTERKVGFRLPPFSGPAGKSEVLIELFERGRRGERKLDEARFEVNVVEPHETYSRTFVSDIDGSVQYFSVVPQPETAATVDQPALFFSLHGASVEAINQARAYHAKEAGPIVAPTNRRPYGFDWEDWGRLDALEVLDLATSTFRTDPLRTYLTGHSMGGHGTWIFGATYPDRFAAIAPSCGWRDFWTYAYRESPSEYPVEQGVTRASHVSRPLGLLHNYANYGVYILHGQADETVPVREARQMKQLLAPFHSDFAYKEVPGAGHWWSNEAVDFPAIFQFFDGHTKKTLPEMDTLHFATANPGVSASAYFATIGQQEYPLEYSRVSIVQDTARSAFSGTTVNVARLGLSLEGLTRRDTVRLHLDGEEVLLTGPEAASREVWLARKESRWIRSSKPSPGEKGPQRSGTFKDAFRQRMVFVYATGGAPEERKWAYDKARFDAESFWYRGNGSVDVVADTDFDPQAEPDRGVILYGNADTHEDWAALLGMSPVQVRRNAVAIGDRTLKGDDLAALFVRPRPGSDVASVAVVSGTGRAGLVSALPNPYFMAGAGYPDLFVYSADMLLKGAEGVRAWGYFGNDWSVENGDWLRLDPNENADN